MNEKYVRFARVRNANSHFAGHYPIPCIEAGDVVVLWSRTVNLRLLFQDQELRSKFETDIPVPPAGLTVTAEPGVGKPVQGTRLTARVAIDLRAELRKSNLLVCDVTDADDGRPVNCDTGGDHDECVDGG